MYYWVLTVFYAIVLIKKSKELIVSTISTNPTLFPIFHRHCTFSQTSPDTTRFPGFFRQWQ